MSPTVEVVIPVYNEAQVLEASIRRLHVYLSAGFPFSWRVTVVDNASSDATLAVAEALAAELPGVSVVHVDRKGRGLALRTAWMASDAAVVVYMDVDLSTGLDACFPSSHRWCPVTRTSRSVAASRRAPTWLGDRERELISKSYNLILRTVFSTRLRDAECGFKAVRTDIARRLVPAVEDDAWFFDTELLLLAEHNGLRILEVPVDWHDDSDTCVVIVSTAIEDLKGVARVAWRFVAGHGELDLGVGRRRPFADDMGRRLVVFSIIGIASTAVSLALFLVLRARLGPALAVVVALVATAIGNSWAHRRWTLGHRGREGLARRHSGLGRGRARRHRALRGRARRRRPRWRWHCGRAGGARGRVDGHDCGAFRAALALVGAREGLVTPSRLASAHWRHGAHRGSTRCMSVSVSTTLLSATVLIALAGPVQNERLDRQRLRHRGGHGALVSVEPASGLADGGAE